MSSVAILAPAFFDHDGQALLAGGAERYLWELSQLLRSIGHHVEIFQAAHQDWHHEYQGLQVHGLSPVVLLEDTWPRTNERFQQAAQGFARHIYLSWNMAYPHAKPGSIGISHSLWWDDHLVPRRRGPQWLPKVKQALEGLSALVANDTNLINWVRIHLPHLERKISFIPNFVDTDRFCPVERSGPPDPFRVLFPRRLELQKGVLLMLEVADCLTAERADIAFHFVGQGAPALQQAVAERARQNPRIQHEWREPDQMAAVYQAADLVVLPTLATEGTSLSALEAMACGVPVIASWVGGLSNLIIDPFNGLLLPPTPERFSEAILRLQADEALRALFSRRGLEVAEAHSLTRWRERWYRLLQESPGP